MEKLELSKEQINKLLQMCDDLFHEYEKVIIPNDYVVFLDKDSVIKDSSYHWFELCVMQLPKRIAENTNTVDTEERHRFIVDMMVKRMLELYPTYKDHPLKHPVDYLFEMYQKTLKHEE
jgi:hypothetical protein